MKWSDGLREVLCMWMERRQKGNCSRTVIANQRKSMACLEVTNQKPPELIQEFTESGSRAAVLGKSFIGDGGMKPMQVKDGSPQVGSQFNDFSLTSWNNPNIYSICSLPRLIICLLMPTMSRLVIFFWRWCDLSDTPNSCRCWHCKTVCRQIPD